MYQPIDVIALGHLDTPLKLVGIEIYEDVDPNMGVPGGKMLGICIGEKGRILAYPLNVLTATDEKLIPDHNT